MRVVWKLTQAFLPSCAGLVHRFHLAVAIPQGNVRAYVIGSLGTTFFLGQYLPQIRHSKGGFVEDSRPKQIAGTSRVIGEPARLEIDSLRKLAERGVR